MKVFIILFCSCLYLQVFSQAEFIGTVDPASGLYLKIDSIPGLNWITASPGYTTFDHINNRYIYRGADAAMNWFLYSVDVTTGNVVSNPPFPILSDPADNIIELEYDNSTGILYGLHWDASLQTEFLVSIDPNSGIHTIVSSIPGVQWITTSPGYTTFDHINGKYIFRGADAGMNWALYSIDVSTGNVVSNPPFPILSDPADNIIELQYDNSTGNLYGLHWDASSQTEFFVSIDLNSGNYTIINSIPGLNWITTTPHYTTFDHINGRYIFRGADATMNWSLYSIDVNTGNIVYNPSFPALIDPTDNIIELQYNNDTGILYALHWDAYVSAPNQCDYMLQMYDSWGDGWNGSEISVLVNGTPTFGPYTLATFPGTSGTEYFSVGYSDVITIEYTAGFPAFENEVTYELIQGGVILFSDGPTPTTGNVFSDTCQSSVGLEEIAIKSVNLYPNPVNDVLKIDNPKFEKFIEINVIDYSGKLIKSFDPMSNSINVSNLTHSIYFLQLITEKTIITKKFAKQ